MVEQYIKKPYSDEKPVFKREVKKDRHGKVLYNLITPLNYSAMDWAVGNLHNAVRWGKSYIVDETRGAKLSQFMKYKEQFTILY